MTKFNLIILVIALFSCTSNKVDDDSIIDVDFYKANQRSISAEELFDSVEIVPLETTSDCLLDGDCRLMAVTDSFIIVNNPFYHAFLFERKTGRFIHEIGKRGNGPDEYLWICDHAFSEETNILYLDQGRKWIGVNILTNRIDDRVMKPATSKNFMGNHNLSIVNCYRTSYNEYLGYVNNISGDSPERMLRFDKEGRVSKVYKNTNLYIQTDKKSSPYSPGHFYTYSDSLFFYGGILKDTIYHVGKDHLSPYLVFNSNKEKLDYANWLSVKFADICDVKCAMEYTDIILFAYMGGDFGWGCGFYDKRNKKTVLSNNEDVGIVFTQKTFPSLYIVGMNESGDVYGYWTANSLKDYLEENKIDKSKIPLQLQDINIDDNPVVVIGRIKNELI